MFEKNKLKLKEMPTNINFCEAITDTEFFKEFFIFKNAVLPL